MTLTQPEKDALKVLFKNAGFLFIDSGKYRFTNKRKTTSMSTFLKMLGAPGCFEGNRDLVNLDNAFLRKSISAYYPALDELAAEWSRENKPASLILSTPEVDESDEKEAESAADYIRTLVPCINIAKGTKDQLVLLDPHRENRPAIDIEPEVFLALTERNIGNMISDDSVLKVMTTFDPYTLKSLYVRETKTGSLTTWHVNYYIPPRWRFLDVAPAYDGFIKKLVEHLFPNEDEREYVLDWLHYAIVFRNDTVLCLIGPRGTGKGVLLKDVLGQLIGEEYREIVNQEILTDKFNAAFKNKRYIFFDEVNVSGDRELNKFKAFCNSTIALEEKGRDSETIENYTSLGLSSNDKKDFKAEPQERRFSVPEVTDTPLLDICSEEEVEDFITRISNPESAEIAAFGNWLIQRKPKNSSRRPLKGKYFFNLCRLSMPEWKTYIIDFLVNEGIVGECILNSTISKKFKKAHGEHAHFATKRGTIETFLGDYYHEGVCRIGRVVDAWDSQRGRDTFAILPDEDFLRKFGANYRDVVETEATVVESDDALDAL